MLFLVKAVERCQSGQSNAAVASAIRCFEQIIWSKCGGNDMKKTIVTFFTLATLLCFVDYSQAQQITLSQGIFERGGPYHIQSPFEPFTGNFLFTALNTRVSGNIVSNSSGVSYTEGLVDCCIYVR